MNPRLLFVDDEPRVLQGLRQGLWSQRKRWDMSFVGGGADALRLLEEQAYRAVISDMRMPGMDGAELLARVRAMQPGALRVVLSGQMDERAAVRAAGTAHRFLAKPCETQVLIDTLSQALALADELGSPEVLDRLGAVCGLPSPPETCSALQRALDSQVTSISEVAQIVERDPAVSSKVLQLVNSAFFGLGRRVVSIEQAVMQLGGRTLRSLVLASALFQQLGQRDTRLLEREQTRALLATQLARRFPLAREQSETATTAALLHNVGRLALLAHSSDGEASAAAYMGEHGVGVLEAEQALWGVSHATLGGYLLGLWGLPAEVVAAVRCHHQPLADKASLDAATVVFLVEGLVAELLGDAPSVPAAWARSDLERIGAWETVQQLRLQPPSLA